MQIMPIFRLPFSKLLLTFIWGVAIAYLLICISLLLWQNRLIFFPSPQLEITPDELSLPYQDVWLPVATNTGKVERIHGWWLPSASPSTGVLLYLHGNGVNISANIYHAQRFHSLGFSVLLIDYRGYGISEGDFPTEAQVYQDAKTALDYLMQQRGIAERDIFLYGHSLGGAIAIDLAAEYPQVAGAIIESSFTSMREMIDYLGKYRFFPANWLLTHKFDSLSKIESLSMPLLFIHGTSDRTIPASMSQALYNAATAPKQILLVPDAEHSNVASVSGEEYLQTVRDFYQLVRTNQGKLAER